MRGRAPSEQAGPGWAGLGSAAFDSTEGPRRRGGGGDRRMRMLYPCAGGVRRPQVRSDLRGYEVGAAAASGRRAGLPPEGRSGNLRALLLCPGVGSALWGSRRGGDTPSPPFGGPRVFSEFLAAEALVRQLRGRDSPAFPTGPPLAYDTPLPLHPILLPGLSRSDPAGLPLPGRPPRQVWVIFRPGFAARPGLCRCGRQIAAEPSGVWSI